MTGRQQTENTPTRKASTYRVYQDTTPFALQQRNIGCIALLIFLQPAKSFPNVQTAPSGSVPIIIIV
jgi:hypothetical protein